MRALKTGGSPMRGAARTCQFQLGGTLVGAFDPSCASLRPPLSPPRASIRGKTEAVGPRRLPFEPA